MRLIACFATVTLVTGLFFVRDAAAQTADDVVLTRSSMLAQQSSSLTTTSTASKALDGLLAPDSTYLVEQQCAMTGTSWEPWW